MNLEDALEKMKKKASERVEKSSRFNTQIVYVPDGVTKFRPYLDSEGEVIRTGFRHKIRGKKVAVPCLGPDECKICKRLKEISDTWDEAWRFGSQEYTIMYVWIFESSVPHDNPFMRLNEPVILMGNAKLANEVSYQIKDIESVNELKAVFNHPTEPSSIWVMRYQRENNSLSLEFSPKKAIMDPLPEDFPPLREAYFKEGEPPNEEVLSNFLRELESSYQRFLNLTGSSSYNSYASVVEPVLPEEKTSSVSSDEPETREFDGTKTPVKVVKEGQYPSCFGHLDENDPRCLLCKIDTLCQSKSSGI